MKDIQEEIDFLGQYITEHKKKRIEEVLNYRTRYISLLLEDIYQPHNASAVLRSCDSYGIQDVHIIENKNEYRFNPLVTQGAEKWLDIYRYNENSQNTHSCVKLLKANGYKIIATALEGYDYKLPELPLDQKFALAFGTEKHGVSKELIEMADYKMMIPMFGFSQSFNVSVSAAISLQNLIEKLHRSSFSWRLNDDEKMALRLKWYQKVTRFSER